MSLWTRLKTLARILKYRLLPLKWTFALAACLIRAKVRRNPKQHERTERLLKPFLPSDVTRREIERDIALSRTIYRIGARTHAPVFRRSKGWILRTFRPQGLAHLDEAKRAGRGVIILGTGAGLKAWVAPILRQLGHPLRLMQRERITAENLLLMQWDDATGEVLPFPEDRERGIHLKRLHDLVTSGVWIQHVGHHADDENGIAAKLLGADVRCHRAPWALARLADAPLIPAAVLMDRDYHVTLLIGPPIRVDRQASPEGAMAAALQTYLDFVAQNIFSTKPWNLILPSHWEGLILGE